MGDSNLIEWSALDSSQVQEREIVLANTGKASSTARTNCQDSRKLAQVAFQFNWNLCALSRPPVLDCWPVSGQINPGDKEMLGCVWMGFEE